MSCDSRSIASREKGQWDLEALKIEFEELILFDAPIEITGFSPPRSTMSFSATPPRD